MRRILPVALITSVLVLVPASPAGAAHERVAGADRFATSAAVSASAVAADREAVFVASGLDFPDALAAAPVAGSRRTSVLLVTRDAIPDAVRTELERISPDRIYVVGGSASVSTAVEQELATIAAEDVVRLAGADRYGTAANVSASYFSPGVAYVYVATGESFADALAAGAGGVDRGPVVLVTHNAIPAATAAELQRLDPQEIIVVGGTGAVDASVEAGLGQYTDGPVTRQAGDDRYATSAIVSSGAFQAPTDAAYLVSGSSFADALSGGPIAGANDGPVLLVQQTCVPDTVQNEIDRLAPARIVVFGGTGAVSDAAAERARCDAGTGPLGTTPTVIATGLDTPWDVAFEPDGTAFITERNGRLLQMEPGGAPTLLQTIPGVEEDGEGGLLGLERDSDGFLYAYYTTATDNRVSRFRPGETPTPIFTGIPRGQSTHFGGRLAFGPDDLLYVTTGDAADPLLAQDSSSLAGKILRINRDGSIPAGNVAAGSAVYSLGHRNPQGLAWERSERFWSAELGPGEDDEINVIVAGGNYGWGGSGGIAPVVERDPSVASWSGAAIVDGGVTAWDGDLLVAALRGRRLYRFDLAADGTVIGGGEELFTETYGRLRHIEQAPDGSLWLLTSNRDGRGNPVAEDDRIIRIG